MGLPFGGTLADGIHRLPVRVYYEDTDTAQIVYYANYLRFLERGRSEYVRALGIDQSGDMAEGPDWRAFVVRRVEVDYLTTAKLDDLLEVRTTISTLRRASMIMSQDIRRGETRIITAEVTIACLDRGGKPRRLPHSFDEIVQVNL